MFDNQLKFNEKKKRFSLIKGRFAVCLICIQHMFWKSLIYIENYLHISPRFSQ